MTSTSKWRRGRIWRLGERELMERKYYPPPNPYEFHDAREDRNPSELSLRRFYAGLDSRRLTSVEWHLEWSGK